FISTLPLNLVFSKHLNTILTISQKLPLARLRITSCGQAKRAETQSVDNIEYSYTFIIWLYLLSLGYIS
ncbi:MAG: hypothetical protein U9Q77_05175, partial [Candidatus Marinimicrobia bacterium]|nr:hypothetical protein [Candidatus Neomarinimicrobiota bacterium]